jgi:hypothetical protein
MSMLTLLCYVHGDDYKQAFPVKIGREETVAELKKSIKKEKSRAFRDIDADSIVLWSRSILCDRRLKAQVEGVILAEDDSLEPQDILSDVFSAGLKQRHIHVVVKRPDTGEQ